jgi:hypothetical protein
LLTLALAACGGESATSPYDCINATGGCYNYAQLSQSNGVFTRTPVAFYTDLDVVPLTCDSACRASSGNLTTPGYISNYVTLFDASGTYFIRAGYYTFNGHDTYFYDSRLPGQAYSTHPLGDTHIGPNPPAADYPDTWTSTGVRFDKTSGTSPGWYVTFHLRHDAAMGAVGDHSFAVTGPSFILTSFQPYRVTMGQLLYGHSGATAIFASFANNQVAYDTLCIPGPLGTSCANLYGQLTGDGSVVPQPSPGVPPPYANWIVRPSAHNSNGGVFYTECCRPLHIDIGS